MKRRILRYIIAGIVMIVVLVALWICVVVSRIPSYVNPDTSDWHTGDIFFSVGDSWKSVAVRSITGVKNFGLSDTTPSHCGIVIVDSGTVRLVHESTSAKRIVMETPEEYLQNNGSYCLYARRLPCSQDSVRVVHVIDSLMEAGIPFDFDFDHTDDGSLYCTEMVLRVMELSDCTNLSDLRDLGYIYPQDILNRTIAP